MLFVGLAVPGTCWGIMCNSMCWDNYRVQKGVQGGCEPLNVETENWTGILWKSYLSHLSGWYNI